MCLKFYNICNKNQQFYNNKLKGEERIGPHNEEILSIIIGSLLGDAHAERRSYLSISKLDKKGNTRISFHQGSPNVEYLM